MFGGLASKLSKKNCQLQPEVVLNSEMLYFEVKILQYVICIWMSCVMCI